MLERLRYVSLQQYFSRENALLLLLSIAGFWMAWNTIFVVLRNNELIAEIEQLRGEVELLELENQNLTYSIEYYKTDNFVVRSAKEDLLLAAPGEKVAIAPKTVNSPFVMGTSSQVVQEESRNNPQQWLDFVLGR